MKLVFSNKKITGILTVLPAIEVKFEDEMDNYNFSIAKSLKLKTAMGYNTRRIVDEKTSVSDLCIHGLDYLFENNLLIKEDVDAIILVTQSPDYFMPPTSNIIQGHFQLKHDMICLDISQGCAGYLVGLFQAFMMLEQPTVKKVVLLNADILSRKVSKRDRNSNPLIGDGASITIVENSTEENTLFGNIKMDGMNAKALMIPAGGFKEQPSIETSIMTEDSAGNFRSREQLVMKGDEVFNFVQRAVPPMIEELLKDAGIKKEEIDYFMFHQPNKFMLQKLADKIGVQREKMPSNIVEHFGNSSGVSIPTTITFNLHDQLINNAYQMCLAGFGTGLTWASLSIIIGHLDFCKIIYN
jgi:3-oxoacyl-[acyl-carrier-protein] synthase III